MNPKPILSALACLIVLTACLPGPIAPAATSATPPMASPALTPSPVPATTQSELPPTSTPPPDKYALWQQPSYFRGMNVNPTRNFIGDTDEGGEVIIRAPLLAKSDLQALRDLGANLVLASYPGPYRFNPPYELDPDYQAYLDNLVDWAEEVGLYVVIAPRTGPGRSEHSFAAAFDETPDYEPWEAFWLDQAAQEKWKEMWQFIAGRYAGRPHVVGYDLMVEPHPEELGIEPDEWYAFAEELIQAIRQVDTETPIIVPVTVWSSAYGFETAVRLSDDRLVYDVHQYEPFPFTHQFDPQSLTVNYPGEIEGEYWDRDRLLELLQPVRDFQEANGAQPAATWMDDSIFAIELKPKGRVARLAHTRSVFKEGPVTYGEKDYWAEPHASVNQDFTRVLFTSSGQRDLQCPCPNRLSSIARTRGQSVGLTPPDIQPDRRTA